MNNIICGDSAEVLKTLDANFHAIITDPPYPNYHQDLYGYEDGMIDFLNNFPCRQFVFWTITEPFPLSYTARHTWDKVTGTYARYEYIYERNGRDTELTFRYAKIQNEIDAQMNRDVKTIHPSQKPIRLMKAIISRFQLCGKILDPFMGSGSTVVACAELGLPFVGIEREPRYFDIARRRIAGANVPLPFFAQAQP